MIRKVLVGFAAATAVLVVPATAFAHVEITAGSPPNSDDLLSAEVFSENECSGALSTLQVVFPETPALTIATPGAVDGWTSAVEKRAGSESVASVTWTNTAAVTGDSTFPIDLGSISGTDATIDFKALQTCSDGKVFRWIEKGENSEFPAPVLALDHSGHSGHDATPSTTKVAVTTTKKSSDDSNTGVIVGVAAGAAVLLGIGAVLFLRSKK